MTTCSYDLVKTLWPEHERAFRSWLHRAGLYQNVFGLDGEGLSLYQFHEALVSVLPYGTRFEVWEGPQLTAASLLSAGNRAVLVNYQEDEDDEDSGHWALLLPPAENVNQYKSGAGVLVLFSPGYSGDDRLQHFSLSTLLARVRSRYPDTGKPRGVIII